MLQVDTQKKLFGQYVSLNLQDKIYQVKSLRLAQQYTRRRRGKMALLDIGCSDGSFAAHAGEVLSAATHGVDIASTAVRKAKRVLDTAKCFDINNPLPFDDNSFDIVFALEVIEHVFDTDLLVSEIRRVLKRGGAVILSTPNLASLKNRVRLALNRYPEYLEYSTAGAGHIHLYTSEVLVSQLSANKLKIAKLCSPNCPAPGITSRYAPKFYREIMMKLGDALPTLGSHLIVVAVK